MSLGASHALDASVLALNKFYMAVHVISVRRAVARVLAAPAPRTPDLGGTASTAEVGRAVLEALE